ncbi:DUF423 domain-containing protein [Algoriphagus sediminis]|uniref:DUF423 domain-containing protein n=1 Tax=Algoriphagus sediminis TaxID=3057113 RepID=A0ABT7YAG7_9BACT|nr:DUF423 domain-containing protein [Algoriphagus sediminis]MDN3203488.1 DUF423 domain-containing protein [Algoriphagus sediminis]
MKGRQIIQLAAVFGALSVAIGAFGAHSLQEVLEESGRTETFQTAVSYQFFHSLLLVAVGITYVVKPHWKKLRWAALFIVIGILFFSGSLYALSLTGISRFGAVAPFGGLSLILGWMTIIFAVKKRVQ